MWWIYNILLTVLAPLWVPWMLLRTLRRSEKPNWSERFGNFNLPPRNGKRRIWFHAVSVGEVVAATPILRELRSALPKHEVILTVTTSSGHQTAREKLDGLYDHLCYFPLDVPRFMLAAMQRVRPDVVAVMETELWMNHLWAAKVFGARTLLVNGRISDRSFPRAMKLRFFYRALLRDMDRCLMQTETDVERILALGAPSAERIGNSKFDQAIEGTEADPDYWRAELGLDSTRPTVVVGSLRAEEFGYAKPLMSLAERGVQVIVAPRHAETSDSLEEALGGDVARRSKGHRIRENLLILDTYGELSQVYAAADLVVVGGGFANLGGQNILQPLAHGKPVLHGPNMQNFRDVSAMAQASGATIVCSTAEELLQNCLVLLENPSRRELMGNSAVELVRANLGASQRYGQSIASEVSKAK